MTTLIMLHYFCLFVLTHSLYTHFTFNWRTDLPVRTLGAVVAAPVTAAPEENILCYDEQPRHLDDLLLKSLAIGILNLAAARLSSLIRVELDSIYEHAMRSGWWASTNAARGPESYFVSNNTVKPCVSVEIITENCRNLPKTKLPNNNPNTVPEP